MASLASRATRLLRKKFTNMDEAMNEIVMVLQGEDEETTSSTSESSSASSSPTALSGTSTVREFTVVTPSYDKDYIRCTDPEGETIYLAKPYLLRPSTWQGQTYLINPCLVNHRLCKFTIIHDFLVTDENQRTVRARSQLLTSPGDIIETIFTESILPFYKVGDKIYGIRHPAGFPFAGGDGSSIEWLDLNTDGRTWRTDASLQLS